MTKRFTDLMVSNDGFRFEPIDLNNGITLSIQASSFHYSMPKVSGLSPDEYDEYEVAVIKNDKVIDPKIEGFSVSEYDGNIYTYLEKESVQALYEELSELTEEQVDSI
jgi:hypothetical protein